MTWSSRGLVPAVVVAILMGALSVADAAAPDGKALYVRHCESCHGVTGRGDGVDAGVFPSPPRDLRSGFLERYPTDELVRRVRSGVPLVLALDLAALRARANEVEAIAAHLERLPSVDWRRVEIGQAIYLDRCELCHGPTGTPKYVLPSGARSPRDLSDPAFQASFDPARLATVVRHGLNGMPAVDPPVTADELPAVVAFVRMLSPGYTLYDRYCAACHGDDGRGSGSDDPPTVVFDRAYFRRRDPEQVRTAIWHMVATQQPAMPHFRRTLTAEEVRAVIVYLRSAD
jgi:mono/diheme cytochrome c family protein